MYFTVMYITVIYCTVYYYIPLYRVSQINPHDMSEKNYEEIDMLNYLQTYVII